MARNGDFCAERERDPMAARETTEQRLDRRFLELCQNDLTRAEWEEARLLLSLRVLTDVERRDLQRIVLARDYVALIQFIASRARSQEQRGLEWNWAPLWVFLAWVSSSLLGIPSFLYKLLRIQLACLRQVCRRYSVFLAVSFCLFILFGWFSLAGLVFKYFGYMCRLLALDYSVLDDVASPGNQTCGNRDAFNQSSCCSDVMRFDFAHYWNNTPAARQMVVKRAMEDLEPELTNLVNVWSDKYLREQAKQAKRLAKIEEEFRANQQSMAKQSSFMTGVMVVFGVYAGIGVFRAGRQFYNQHHPGQGLAAARAAACARAAMQRMEVVIADPVGMVPSVWEASKNVFVRTLAGLVSIGYVLGNNTMTSRT